MSFSIRYMTLIKQISKHLKYAFGSILEKLNLAQKNKNDLII